MPVRGASTRRLFTKFEGSGLNVAVSTLELCAGVGMLGEGLRAGLRHMGVETRCVCYVEREGYAVGNLAARMEEGSLDAAAIWSDMLTFDGRQFHGAVDCVVAGFPCQDLSIAGLGRWKRKRHEQFNGRRCAFGTRDAE
jgi:site-specific DNA-cytosine methylase